MIIQGASRPFCRVDGLSLVLAPCLILSPSAPFAPRAFSSTDGPSKSSARASKKSSKSASPDGLSSARFQYPSRGRRSGFIRLDPTKSLLSLPTLGLSAHRSRLSDNVAERSKALSQLHTALDSGDPDQVFEAYLQVPKDVSDEELAQYGEEYWASRPMRTTLTADEMRRVVRVLSSDTPKLRKGMLRLVSIIDEIKRRRKWAHSLVEKATRQSRDAAMTSPLSELHQWDTLLDARALNALIAFTGRCVRAAGPGEVDEALRLLATVESDSLHKNTSDSKRFQKALVGPRVFKYLSAQKDAQSRFPDRATYNTLLDIVGRSVTPFTPRTTRSPNEMDDDENDLPTSRSMNQHGSASVLSDSMRKLGLEPEHDTYTTVTAERIFNALLDRMRVVSKIEPNAITYNTMINFYCRLQKWDKVERTVGDLLDNGLLNVSTVNAIMWSWGKSVKEQRVGIKPIEEVEQVYRLMRGNLVALERRRSSSQNSTNHKEEGEGEYPLQWSDRNERDDDVQRRHPPPHLVDDAGQLAQILHFDQLPKHIIPDEVTYSLLIKLQTFRGNFAGALGTFKDMMSTSRVTLSQRPDESYELVSQSDEEPFKPNLAIYDSFFRGFAKHGIPSLLVHFDPEDPLSSTWASVDTDSALLVEHVQQRRKRGGLWNMQTFTQIFEGFLRLQPDTSIRAPTANQLFFVFTAMRRVSGDEATWSLAMWEKVKSKFSEETKWKGFITNARLERVERYLEGKRIM